MHVTVLARLLLPQTVQQLAWAATFGCERLPWLLRILLSTAGTVALELPLCGCPLFLAEPK